MSSRRVVIAGGSGFLGSALVEAFTAAGCDAVVLSRSASGAGTVQWSPDGTSGSWQSELEGAAAVINLAGESLAGGRWTANRKQRLRDSRLKPTRSLVAAMRGCRNPPGVFLSASGVGYYGVQSDTVKTESSSPGTDFLARLCVDWESAAEEAALSVGRVVLLRSAVVLDSDEGILPRVAMPFKFFVGGPIGSGRQYMSWIHLRDWVRMVQWAIDDEGVDGPLNATSPEPATNEEFSRAVAAALHRPAFMRAPAAAIRLMLGEMADGLVLGGQRALPEKAMSRGFRFQYPQIGEALRDLLR